MFQLQEVNQMERRDKCQYLEWELNVDAVPQRDCEEMIHKAFVGPGPYPIKWSTIGGGHCSASSHIGHHHMVMLCQ